MAAVGVGAKEEEQEEEAEAGSDEIGLISRRAEAFRVKMLKHFQLLDVFDEGGMTGAETSDSPNLQTVDIVEDGLRKPMMATEPNALVQFHIYTDKFLKSVTAEDRRRNRVRNKNTRNPPLDLWASWVVHSPWFKNFIVVVLVINAVIIGLQADLGNDESFPSGVLSFFEVIDLLSLLIFCIEIILKWIDDFGNFWSKKWNIYDLIITGFCLIIEVIRFASFAVEEEEGRSDLSMTAQSLRSFRILRSLKLISRLKAARDVIVCVTKAVKSIAFITILMFIFAYIYAVVGVLFFKYDKRKAYDFPKAFDTIGAALKTLFQIFSNDHWLPIMKDIADVTDSVIIPPLYVATWLVLSCYIFGNILIGIIVNSYQEAVDNLREADLKAELRMKRDQRESAFANELDSAAARRKTAAAAADGGTVSASAEKLSQLSSGGEMAVERWVNMVEKNILDLAIEDVSFCWPRDTLLRYFLLMESLQENLEERKRLLDLANHAVLQMFDV